MRRLAAVVILMSVVALAPGVLLGAGGSAADRLDSTEVLLVGNPVLRASLERIHQGSHLWRSGVARAAATGRRVVVVTSDQVVVADPGRAAAAQPFDPHLLGEVSVILGHAPQVEAVLVAINLRLIDESHRRLGLPWSQRDADLDRVVIHEVYGHALPYILAGDISGKCADPGVGESAATSCAITRENAVRAELGLGRRVDAGLWSLALARGPAVF